MSKTHHYIIIDLNCENSFFFFLFFQTSCDFIRHLIEFFKGNLLLWCSIFCYFQKMCSLLALFLIWVALLTLPLKVNFEKKQIRCQKDNEMSGSTTNKNFKKLCWGIIWKQLFFIVTGKTCYNSNVWKKLIFQKSNIPHYLLFLESCLFKRANFSKDATFYSSYHFRKATFLQHTFS